ncbi:MAG TPA: prenyltransferase/squalene oxidase repeat-containing protein [Pirellulales bacterium]|jgi:hypothetical protein|nr:prenyltransferase/squalene oxidase repeat-containing protein [Pirellulales bacterium]
MHRSAQWLSIVLACALAQLASAADQNALPAQAAKAVELAVPYLEDNGEGWIVEKKCISCHYVSFMVWSLESVRHAGLKVDEPEFTRRSAWSYANGKSGGLEGMAQMILARPHGKPDAKLEATLLDLAYTIAAQQKPDGSWPAGGQLPGQKRPPQETHEVTTRWALLALHSLDRPKDDKLAKSQAQALAWLKNAKPGKSNEWYATRLLVEHQIGSAPEAQRLAAELLAAQQSDGGWPWLRGDKSDALATGQVLYALAQCGSKLNDPAIERACKFLISTQQPDGEWLVNSTKAEKKDNPRHTSNYWGTAWATIGLSDLLAAEQSPPREKQPSARVAASKK